MLVTIDCVRLQIVLLLGLKKFKYFFVVGCCFFTPFVYEVNLIDTKRLTPYVVFSGACCCATVAVTMWFRTRPIFRACSPHSFLHPPVLFLPLSTSMRLTLYSTLK